MNEHFPRLYASFACEPAVLAALSRLSFEDHKRSTATLARFGKDKAREIILQLASKHAG